MADVPDWVGAGIDLEQPSAARVYDYYLGGSHNFPADRAMARRAIAEWPELPLIMQANRAFLRRAVTFLVDAGVRQFLDLGSGIPTVGNVHEVARAVDPGARVVYVDIDPVAVAHSRAILAGDGHSAVVHADFRDVDAVLAAAQADGGLDLSRPVGLLMVALLHFVPSDPDPAGVIARYRAAMAPGSHLVLSHATAAGPADRADGHTALYRRAGTPMTMRSREEVTALLSGFDLIEPGMVYLPSWRPEPGTATPGRPEDVPGLAAVARRG